MQGQIIRKQAKKNKEKDFQIELIKIQHQSGTDLEKFLLSLSNYISYPNEYWFDNNEIVMNDSLNYENEATDNDQIVEIISPSTSNDSTIDSN
ncbi:unnamed protein product, partial [Brachionus calyciflorus]